MSFVRVGRPQQHSKGKRPVRPKKATTAPKREWVSTVNDLSVHKLTPAELSHRHEIHKSHNKAVAQWELKEKALKRRFRHAGSPAPLDQASLSIIREVFSDQLLLQDVLARSDRAMAVVKDLFGDAPRRQTGHPSVTIAPNCDSDSELPVHQRPDPPTHLSLLSQSMMDQEALNELEASEEGHKDINAHPSCSSEYNVIRRTNVRKMKTQTRSRVMQQQKVHHSTFHQEDEDNVPVTPFTSGRAPDQAALNATVAVQRVRSKQSQSEEDKEETSVLVSQVLNPELPLSQSGRIRNPTSRTRKCVSHSSQLDGSSVASLSGDQSSLGLLQSMLGQVEADLDALSPDTVAASAQSPKQQRTQGLTGFSVALVSTLGRVVHLLKQREDEAQKEAEERRRLEEEVKEQRGLIDALTAETMTLREEAAALQAGLQQRTAELEQKLDSVVLVMGGLGLLGEHISPHQDSDVHAAVSQPAPIAEQVPEKTRVSVSPAVLLSPPRQSNNWHQSSVTHPVPLQRNPVETLRSFEDFQAHGSASSLNSLLLTRLTSTSSLSQISDPLRSHLSPSAMLAEIAQLNRQNDLIKVQLSQAKGLELKFGVSLDNSSERSRSSSSSTGRVTPQSVEGRRTSGSSSSGRRSQKIQTPEKEQLTQQAKPSNTLITNHVEQRLLELNRQSAAARGRLLDLIEQQKQNVSARVSPSVSPIPPSAFSPNTAAEGGSREVSVLLPERELWSNSGGDRRYAGSDVSSHSSRKESSDGKTQMDKQREREGWFALSAHVR
ncbi:spindle and centriole-associated protein 1 [Stegastes partitus]|uniref:Spindle and centriole-associated protein 1 n=1 Tax=Stegastes partitus TaxID=144197 RepID=A0A3B5BG10_9TELE|nr:PREDICTED: spindle and centriole-associated protein 1 [Stegastes partitus]